MTGRDDNTAGGTILERNLRALAFGSPRAAEQIRAAAPRGDIEWAVGDDGLATARVTPPGGPSRQLCSLRRPGDEAGRWADAIDLAASPGLVIAGFGVGHHIAALGRRVKRTGAIVCFEPDVGLLRAVLGRVDHSAWILAAQFVLITQADDGAIAHSIEGIEGVLAAGVRVVDHPPSGPRLGGEAGAFRAAFSRVMAGVRTNIVTTMVQVETAAANALLNAGHYVTRPGVEGLAGAARGHAAVVVSAGPSLARNIELLHMPGLRDRVVIIAAQTVLKPLLARGIRPHFVTALDYHEISRRFYEGLTAMDVEGVTLVVEPQANPAILDAFPGVIRPAAERVLDAVLGPELAPPRGELRPGATVAHLAYYLARHLGCDPVILIGQDLGFTDGQYYAAGAAIHRVWGGEVNPFRSLEMLEWERIVRGRGTLRRATDHLGRGIYTDEQMATYLLQFERDFLADKEAGLRVIDATEGGVAKRHTEIMPMERALSAFGQSPLPERFWAALRPPPPADPAALRARAAERLGRVRADCDRLAHLTARSRELVGEMIEHQADQRRVNRLISELHEKRDRAMSMPEAYWLAQHLNQTGTFNRFKADRAIEIEGLTPFERQTRQLERDRTNLEWLGESARRAGELLAAGASALVGGGKPTRVTPAPRADQRPLRTAAVLIADVRTGGLGTPRDLAEPLHAGEGALAWTLRALARAPGLERPIVLTDDPTLARSIVGDLAEIRPTDLSAFRAAAVARRGARLWARSCWRGGVGQLSVFDECFEPGLFASALRERGLDAAVVVGADWPLVDPALVSACVERMREDPAGLRLTFAPAPPGLGACVAARSLCEELASAASSAGSFATLGALLSYIPIAPQPDPIARPNGIQLDPIVRDAGRRFVADQPRARALAAGLLAERGAGIAARDSVAAALDQPRDIEHVIAPEGTPAAALARAVRGATLAGVTIEVRDWESRAWADLLAAARDAGAAGVHLRTRLWGGVREAEALLASGPEVISVDLPEADPPEATPSDEPRRGIARLLAARGAGPLPTPWIVPRTARRDAVYERIEAFYDLWLMHCGSAVIDPLPAPEPGARIAPLPLPDHAETRLSGTTLSLAPGGTLAGVGA